VQHLDLEKLKELYKNGVIQVTEKVCDSNTMQLQKLNDTTGASSNAKRTSKTRRRHKNDASRDSETSRWVKRYQSKTKGVKKV